MEDIFEFRKALIKKRNDHINDEQIKALKLDQKEFEETLEWINTDVSPVLLNLGHKGKHEFNESHEWYERLHSTHARSILEKAGVRVRRAFLAVQLSWGPNQ